MKNAPKPKIIVVLGPTATGKSDLAVILAKKYNGEIISADSRQVYIGLDIGSGKVTKKEMSGIPHHLLDVVSPKKVFSVSQFKKQADKAIETIVRKGKVPIICGGTGFYIQAVVEGIIPPEVKPNKTLRKNLEHKTTPELFSLLKKMDSRRAKEIDRHNKVRLIRAVEIADTLGKVPKQKKHAPYETLTIGLDMPDKILKERIHTRLTKRLRKGMLAEAKKLHTQGVSWKRMESLGLEYRYMARFLQKNISRKELIEQLNMEIWHYAKRQRTWFKRDTEIYWINPLKKKGVGEAIRSTKKFLA